MNKQELVSTMKQERENWDSLINKILDSKAENEIISKNWTLKDEIMHFYYYELEVKHALETRSLQDHPFWNTSIEQRNKDIYKKSNDHTMDEVLKLYKENFDELLAMVEQLEDQDITSQRFFKDSKKTLKRLIEGNSYGHYHEHIPKLKKRFSI